jgi:hypothetical protein
MSGLSQHRFSAGNNALKGLYNENEHGSKVVSIDSLGLAIVPMDIFF